MNNRLALSAVLAAGAVGFGTWLYWPGAPAGAPHWSTIDRYCVDCHNEAEFAGGVAFDALDRDALAVDAEIWEAAVRKLRAGLMPPAGEPRPEAAGLDGLRAWLETTLDEAAAAKPHPGAPLLHRLNRAEYANAVRDLLDLSVDVAALLPGDDSSAGFDNIANALSVSPSLMQAYVSAAAKISRLAVGDPTTSEGITTYSLPRELVQADHIDGLPLGTRGGMLIEHVFPLDAEYEITVTRARGGFTLETVGENEPIEITLNGERVRVLERGGSIVLPVAAGPQTLGVALVTQARPRGVDDLYEVWDESPGVQAVSITGPRDAQGPGDTPSRRRIFVCTPASAEEELPCAREVLGTLATRAFRRPVDDDDATLAILMDFYEQGRSLRGFEAGIQYALARVLVDPQFVFRFEREPDEPPAKGVYALGDFELAARLSFFLWSSIPDDELLAVAREGRLGDPAERARQVGRMLADPKADALVENFASQWLKLRQLDSVNPASNDFDGNLRRALRRETELLFTSILREDRSILDLLDANYTYVDERLARHYGIPNIRGSRFRRVAVGDERRGLLGQGSILTVTSAPNRTSPVTRGAWILENILGTPAPLPPPGVETNLDQSSAPDAEHVSIRRRLERHRESPDCAACHNLIDPLGFALENFDEIGRWRARDSGQAVDATGELWDGTRLDGPAALRKALLERRELFALRVAEKLMTYALGRAVDHRDMPAVRAVVRAAADQEYRLSALVLGIVESTPFLMRSAVDSNAS